MEEIIEKLARCQAFVYLDTEDYFGSYFTQAEIEQWRRFNTKYNRNPEGYPVGMRNSIPYLKGKEQWSPLTMYEKWVWAKVSTHVNPRLDVSMSPPFPWAKYAKDCFLVGCKYEKETGRGCGKYSVISKKAVYELIKNRQQIPCPHSEDNNCRNNNFTFYEQPRQQSMFDRYRDPIILQQESEGDTRVLETKEIHDLLFDNNLPSSMALVTLQGEKLQGDDMKLLKYFAGVGIALFGLWAGSEYLSRRDTNE
jgi:hypothetical protein